MAIVSLLFSVLKRFSLKDYFGAKGDSPVIELCVNQLGQVIFYAFSVSISNDTVVVY